MISYFVLEVMERIGEGSFVEPDSKSGFSNYRLFFFPFTLFDSL